MRSTNRTQQQKKVVSLNESGGKSGRKMRLPPLQHVIQSYDTAFMKKETSDYSAITTWGVFEPTKTADRQLILVDVLKDRWSFQSLRTIAKEQYDYWKPETVIIEAKASGLPLTYELSKLGIPVINFTPSKGNDKHTRVNSVAPLVPKPEWFGTRSQIC